MTDRLTTLAAMILVAAVDIMGTRDLDAEWDGFSAYDRETYMIKAQAAISVVLEYTSAEFTSLVAAKEKAERERDEARTLADDVAADSRKNYQSACQLHNKLESLTAALRETSEALEPFAKIGDIYNYPEKAKCTDEMVSAAYSFFIGEFRRACAAMAEAEKALGDALPATEAHHG